MAFLCCRLSQAAAAKGKEKAEDPESEAEEKGEEEGEEEGEAEEDEAEAKSGKGKGKAKGKQGKGKGKGKDKEEKKKPKKTPKKRETKKEKNKKTTKQLFENNAELIEKYRWKTQQVFHSSGLMSVAQLVDFKIDDVIIPSSQPKWEFLQARSISFHSFCFRSCCC